MQIRRQTQEIIVASIFVTVGLIGIFRALTYVDPMQGEYPTLTSTFTPVLWASMITVLAVIYLLTMTIRRAKAAGTDARTDGDSEARPVATGAGTTGDTGPTTAPSEPIVHQDRGTNGTDVESPRRVAMAAAATAFALIVYCFLLRKVSFLLITIVLLFTLVSIYQGLQRWWKSAIVAIIGGLAIYGVFVEFMKIPL